MRIGFVANALALDCKTNHKFRLASYAEKRLFETVAANLDCLRRVLRFSAEQSLHFYRISSDTIPFASHPICRADWQGRFASRLAAIGERIDEFVMRISMHPGQHVVLNTPDPDAYARSIAELNYHATLLDAMGLDTTAKIQIHIGGVYGDREQALSTFCSRYEALHSELKQRLVIENDERRFSLQACLAANARTGVPVILDTLHHECLNHGEDLREALALAAATWQTADGRPMVDYSSQQPGRIPGTHGDSLRAEHFKRFLDSLGDRECDVMIELRDKDRSATMAARILAARGQLG